MAKWGAMWYNVEQTESWGVGAMAGVEFAGNFAHTIDPKGRVTIPAAFREALAEGFTIGLNNQFAAIALYPKAKWNEKCEQLARIPESDIMGTRYVRLITGNSFSGCELDNQGRVLLPATLRAKVGMDKAIRFVGMGGYLEIWDEQRYLRESDVSEQSIDDLLNYVNGQYYHAPV